MKESLIKNLTILDNLYGVSGNEEAVAEAVKELMEGLYDKYEEDPLGNQYYTRYGKNKDKKFVISAHMDEIGFCINHIEENGLARMLPVGFHDERMGINQHLVAITREGKVIEGVTGCIPFHFLSPEDMKQGLTIADLSLDFGTNTREATQALGVDVGDYVTWKADGKMMNGTDIYCGKSIDDRAACAVLIELMKEFRDEAPEVTIVAVFSTQEEVGMRAGGIIADREHPDFFIGLDLTLARGIPGLEENVDHTEMGKGIALNYFDWDPELGMTGNNIPRKVNNFFEDLCEAKDIPYQKVVLVGGGTDSWSAALGGGGTLCGGIFIPSQYVHSAVGTIDINDMICTERLLRETVREFPF
ncbi:MAG: hypothetical protein Q4D99_00725 [Bacillota bacterium]|nr:hypothetical protein [Bacillota bacterium]